MLFCWKIIQRENYWITIIILALLSILSIFIGYSDVTPSDLLSGDPHAWLIFWQTRLSRTIAVLLVGAALALSGMIMHWHFFVMIFLPNILVLVKMIVAIIFAMIGTLFLCFYYTESF
ncbi:hypothetical protein O97_01471 [Bartonella henselae str. Zeus]|nr:hypothetical protein Q653_01573 [Bartonella henselae JK 42]ETS11050.1 hypothetical protein Q652_01547 [Bartonella henselae JK 41]KEC55858.1 hypothetical protein O97_01471 [Bartonella henselae str. Zeus]KEC58184.1 hypothetical protein O95_01431 [Bartonella henselae JK 53]